VRQRLTLGRTSLPGVVEWLMGAAFAVALVAYMLIGNYARLVADDFGESDAVHLRGYWAEQVAVYQRSDGHFIATAVQTAAIMLNSAVVRVLPAVLIVAWVALVTLGLRHLLPAAGRFGRVLVAAAIVYTTIRIAPSPFLTFYWMTVSLAFIVPLGLLSVLIWLISRPGGEGRRAVIALAVVGVLAFVAAGMAETYTVAQAVGLTLAVAVALTGFSTVWRQRLPMLLAAWVGSVAGLVVELVAPGNVIRAATISHLVGVPRPSLPGLPVFTFVKMLQFAHGLVWANWPSMIALVVLAAAVGARSGNVVETARRTAVVAVGVATFGAAAVVLSALAPSAREFGSLPPLYDQIIPVYVCVCSLTILGLVGGRVVRRVVDQRWTHDGALSSRRHALAGVAAVLIGLAVIIGPVRAVVTIAHDVPALQSYADVKDAQAAAAVAARDSGRASAVVPTIDYNNLGIFSHTGLEELTDDPKYFINEDEATYYGIQSMTITSQPTSAP
jgi:hypothetical protein